MHRNTLVNETSMVSQ